MTPADSLWRAFFILFLLLFAAGATLRAQSSKRYRPQPEYVQLNAPDQEEGRKILSEFKGQGIAGQYYLEFDLVYLPRRGKERLCRGQMWGIYKNGFQLSRLSVRNADGVEFRYLIRGGDQPMVWSWKSGDASPHKLEGKALLEPISDTSLSPFDLQMPFLNWKDFVYEGLTKLRGRPSHQFLLYPPALQLVSTPDLSGVRISLDTQYGALVETELLDASGKPNKTLSLMELKKVTEQWIIKTIDIRDEPSRSKTKLAFTAAALGCDFAPGLFEPETLADTISPPSKGLVLF
jgi:hypothetical protein